MVDGYWGVVVLGSAFGRMGSSLQHVRLSGCGTLALECGSLAVVVHGLSGTSWDLSYLTRDQTLAPCIGSVESYPLNYQVSPWMQDMNESRSISSFVEGDSSHRSLGLDGS